MKKILSTALSFLLIFGTVFSALGFSAVAEGANTAAWQQDFENFSNGTSLKYMESSTFPTNGMWAVNADAGYYNQTFAEAYYDAEGNPHEQTASGKVDFRSAATFTTTKTDDRNGNAENSALLVKATGFTVSMGLEVAKNKDYTLSFWAKSSEDATKFVNSISIISTLNLKYIYRHNRYAPRYNSANANIALTGVSGTKAKIAAWQQYTLTFNSGNFERLYLSFDSVGDADGTNVTAFYLDDFSLLEQKKEYSFDYEDLAVGTNLLTADRSNYPENGQFGYNYIAGYYGQTKAETYYTANGAVHNQTASGSLNGNLDRTCSVTDADAHSGTHSLLVDTRGLTAVMGLGVKKNTNYNLRFFVKGILPEGVTNMDTYRLQTAFVSTTVNVPRLFELNGVLNSKVAAEKNIALASSCYMASLSTAYFNNWNEINLTFNTGNLEKIYLAFYGLSNTTFYLDDLALTILSESVSINEGQSIRTTDPAGLRFKSRVDIPNLEKALNQNSEQNNLQVKEIGFVAIRSDYLNSMSLLKNGVYNVNGSTKTAVTGKAWQSGGTNNIICEDHGNRVYSFRAVLINIGMSQNGTECSYIPLGLNYSVRTYVVIYNTFLKTESVIYGETLSSSVFTVAHYLEKNHSDSDSLNDWNAVDAYLKSATPKGVTVVGSYQTRLAAYTAWKQNQQ